MTRKPTDAEQRAREQEALRLLARSPMTTSQLAERLFLRYEQASHIVRYLARVGRISSSEGWPRVWSSAPTAKEAKTEPCGFVSASSDDGYCSCILLKHDGRHKCMHGWLR